MVRQLFPISLLTAFALSQAVLCSAESPFMLAPTRVEPLNFTLAAFPFHMDGHFVTNIASDNRSLTFEDGSSWEISSSDPYTLSSWKTGEVVTLIPNTSFFRTHDYQIINRKTSTCVNANLKLGPKAFGTYSHWVKTLDIQSGYVYLENGTTWKIDPLDRFELKNWALDDHIILGDYNYYLPSLGHVLINVNLNKYLRATRT